MSRGPNPTEQLIDAHRRQDQLILNYQDSPRAKWRDIQMLIHNRDRMEIELRRRGVKIESEYRRRDDR